MKKTPKQKGYLNLGHLTDPVLIYKVREVQAVTAKKLGTKAPMAMIINSLLARGLKGLT